MKNTLYARLLIVAALLMGAICPGMAQNARKYEHNLMIGAGISSAGDRDLGVALRAAYGLDIMIDDNWSVMPTIGAALLSEYLPRIGMVGGDPDDMLTLELAISGRYRYDGVAFGFGPYVAKCHGDTYYIDWDPSDPRDGLQKFKNWDFGLRPSIMFDLGNHWGLGAQADFGLRNMKIQYPQYDVAGVRRFKSLTAVVAFRF